MRIGLVILPSDSWSESRRQWEWADRVGFSTAWTYDHIRWGGMPDGPWHAAVPVLAAAAAVTERVRLGTLVATPNFRHPVTLARDALALDDLSGGRLDLGLGPGSEGPDATALGQEPWTPAERLARFEEFLQVLQPIVDGEPAARTSHAHRALRRRTRHPEHAGSRAAPTPPHHRRRRGQGARGSPRPTGATGSPSGPPGRDPARPRPCWMRCAGSSPSSDAACRSAGREPSSIGKVLLWTPTEPVIDSVDQFDELTRALRRAGFRPVRAPPSGPDGTLRGRRERRSSGSPSARLPT